MEQLLLEDLQLDVTVQFYGIDSRLRTSPWMNMSIIILIDVSSLFSRASYFFNAIFLRALVKEHVYFWEVLEALWSKQRTMLTKSNFYI